MKRLISIILMAVLLSGCVQGTENESMKIELNEKAEEIDMLNEDISNLEMENEELRTQLRIVEKVYYKHYHFVESVNDNVYMILESGDSESSMRMRKLVKYSYYEEPHTIYESPGLDFRVSPNENMIAICYSEDNDEEVSFVDGRGKLLFEMKLSKFKDGKTPSLYGWSNDSRYFWGIIQQTYLIDSYFIIDTENWKVKTIENKNSYGDDKAINTNNGWLCYSDYPVCLDVECRNEFNKSGATVNLWLYNIFTGDEMQIDSSIIKKFNPLWIDVSTIEYDAPLSDGRMRYVLESEKTGENIDESLSSIMDLIYVEMISGDTLHFSKDVTDLSIVEVVNVWIDALYDRKVNYGITESDENILASLKVNSITEGDNQINIDFNSVYLEFDKIGSQPWHFNNGLKYLISQLTDVEVMNITIDGDDSRKIIHPDGLMIRDLWLIN